MNTWHSEKNKTGFSIIICAFNAEKRLEETLRHLSKLEIPNDIEIELIVVNNNSTDKTNQVALETWKRYGNPYPISIIDEPLPGLSHARRKGVLASKYTFGIFCDDDNWLDSRYVVEALNIFLKHQHVGIIGGCSTPVADIRLPAWFYTKCSSFAVGTQSDVDGDITWRKFVWGAGMCFRTWPLKLIYLKNIQHLTSDRKADTLTSGGDGEISAWFIFLGYRLHYSSNLKFRHYMSENRLTHEYYDKFFNLKHPSLWSTYSSYLTVKYFLDKDKGGIIGIIKYILVYAYSMTTLIKDFPEAFDIISIERQIKNTKQASKTVNCP